MKVVHSIYDEMISFENIYRAWREFRSGKTNKESVCEFEHNLEANLIALQKELEALTYRHGQYERFIVKDPKERIIHKATVRDRVVHTLVARMLEKIYQPTFFIHSYACQQNKGTHGALQALATMCCCQSLNYTRNFWYLKCDIRKFFDNIDHQIVLNIISRKIQDKKFIWLLEVLLNSFHCVTPGTGLPLGNFTSQWLGNIYMNELDNFIKQELRVKFYVRYADDFVFLNKDREVLANQLTRIKEFLAERLKLSVHNDKLTLKKFTGGIDWVGYRILPHRTVLKPASACRTFRKLRLKQIELCRNEIMPCQYYQTVNSYLGQLQHCAGYKLSNQIIYNNFVYDYRGKIY